jgi:hypothetical protein
MRLSHTNQRRHIKCLRCLYQHDFLNKYKIFQCYLIANKISLLKISKLKKKKNIDKK